MLDADRPPQHASLHEGGVWPRGTALQVPATPPAKGLKAGGLCSKAVPVPASRFPARIRAS